MSLLFSACGSRSSDFDTDFEVNNPLPPCPDSPNCVRITQTYPLPIDSALVIIKSVLQKMNAREINIMEKEYRIDAVFHVFLFKDDMAIQLQKADSSSTYVHLRSSSRVGYSDLGVNRRRVRRFLKRMANRMTDDGTIIGNNKMASP